jgi:N-acyl-L-homoserine lactone synthetase
MHITPMKTMLQVQSGPPKLLAKVGWRLESLGLACRYGNGTAILGRLKLTTMFYQLTARA